jgi:hypothetical protein
LETIGSQPNWGCIARKIRWVKTTFTANSTTTLKDVSQRQKDVGTAKLALRFRKSLQQVQCYYSSV